MSKNNETVSEIENARKQLLKFQNLFSSDDDS